MKDPANISVERVLKCGISLALFVFSALRQFVARLLGQQSRSTCVILNYHSIPEEQRPRFAHQLDLIVRHARPFGLDEVPKQAAGTRYVAVTFDDGFENFISQALPELQRRNIPCTVFIILDALGNYFGTPALLEKVMSVEQLRGLPPNLVTLGSHTLTHPFLPELLQKDAFKELLESRLQLEKLLNRRVGLFSFPFGGFTEDLVQLSRQAGYHRVFTTLPYMALGNPKEFVVGRIRADTTDWPLEFRLKIAGAYRWLPWAFSAKHRIFGNPIISAASRSRSKGSVRRVPQALIRKSADGATI